MSTLDERARMLFFRLAFDDVYRKAFNAMSTEEAIAIINASDMPEDEKERAREFERSAVRVKR